MGYDFGRKMVVFGDKIIFIRIKVVYCGRILKRESRWRLNFQ